MKEQLQVLLQLQQLEQYKQIIMQEKNMIDPGEVRRIWQEVRLLTQRIAEAKLQLDKLKQECAQQEAEIETVTGQCQQMEARLYGGEITNLKELEQIKNGCDALRRNIAAFENEELAKLEQCEQIAQQIDGNEELLKQKKQLHAGKQQILAKNLAEYEKKLTQVEAECSELAARVEPDLLGKFRTLGRKMSFPVAKVENGVCGGCRISVPKNRMAVQGRAVVFCDNCGRILLPG